MKKKLLILLLFLPILSFGLFIYHGKKASAAFSANDLIDDVIFDNSSTMNSAQIDSWLNTNFPSSCISTNNGFSAPDPTGYSPNPSQFFYSSAPVSAGQVIYDAAQAYGLNPQVLLTTLEKEESLVSGGAGCASWQYASAVGYGCTDSGTNSHNYSYPGGGLVTPLYYTNGTLVNSITNSCVNSGPKTGFSEQIIHAAWLLAFGRHKSEGDTGWAVIKGNWDNCDDNNTCPAAWGIPASDACYGGPMTEGNFKLCPTDTSTTFFDGYATIDATSVHMDNGATAALYWYTPHLNGNQNFDNIFTSWFGSIYAEPYNYSFVGSSMADLTMEPGYQRVGQFIQIQNIGSQTWYADGSVPAGGHAVRLATRNYVNSPFADPSDPAWLGTKNQIKMTPSTVPPGGIATFVFNLVGPDQLYSTPYTQYFVPVLDGSGFFSDKNLQWRITNQVGSYSFSSAQNFPNTLYPNQEATTTISLTNTGLATWYADGSVPAGKHTVRLATAGYQNTPFADTSDPSWMGTANQIKMTPSSVASGQVATFTFNLHGPLSGTVQSLRFIPVLDGVGFMKDINLFSTITTPTPSVSYSFVSAVNPPSSMSAGSIANVSLTLKNTGTVVWKNNSSGVPNFRIMMTQPNYRNSAFYNSADPAWIAPNQIIYTGSQVGLNGTLTVNFTWKAPNTPGAYTEHFAPVLDGYQLMSDTGMAFTVTVH